MAGADMWAVEVHVQAVGKCIRNRDTYRNILRWDMRGRRGRRRWKEEVERVSEEAVDMPRKVL